MTEPTDYRARIQAALREVYGRPHGLNPASAELIHERATDEVAAILRDLTRDLSEQVAQMKAADADRAARDLGVAATCPAHGPHPHDGMRCLNCPECVGRPAPDAVSTPSPVPATEDARQGGGEAHSGAEDSGAFAVGDTVDRLQVNGAPWYRAEVVEVHEDGLWVRCLEVDRRIGLFSSPLVGELTGAPLTAYGKPCWRKVGDS